MFIANKYQARKFRDEAADDGGEKGGSGEDDAAKKAAEAEAAKKAEEEAAAKKAAEEAEAKKKAEGDKGTSDREAELLRESMQRKKALKEANETIDGLKAKVAEFDGIDLDEVKKLIQDKKDEATRQLEAKGEFEKVKEQMNEAHASEVNKLQETINDLKAQINGRDGEIDKLTIGSAFGQSKFISEKLTLPPTKARVLFGQHFERDDEGKVVGYDKPAGTEGRAPFVDGNGDPLAFDQALQKIVEADADKDSLFRSTAKAGAGSGTDSKGKTDTPDTKVEAGRDRIKAGIDAGLLKSDEGLNLPT